MIVHRGNVDNSNVLCCVPCSGGGTCASDLTADVDIAILQSLSDVQIKSILKQNLRLNSQRRLIIKGVLVLRLLRKYVFALLLV